MSKTPKRTILARRGNREISAIFDGEKFDNWQARVRGSRRLTEWSKPGDRKTHVGGDLGAFFRGARNQDFEAEGYRATAEGKKAASKYCNCNPENLPVVWLPAKPQKPPPPQDRKSGRGSNNDGEPRNAKEWASYLHRLGGDLELPGRFKGCKSLGDVARILRDVERAKAAAREEAALDHAHAWDEAQRERRRLAAERRAAGLPPVEKPRMDDETRKAKDRAGAQRRRDAAKVARAEEQAKRERANERRRNARAAKKGKP